MVRLQRTFHDFRGDRKDPGIWYKMAVGGGAGYQGNGEYFLRFNIGCPRETLEKVWKYWHSLWQIRKGITMDNKKLNFWECRSFCIGQIVGSRRIRTDRYRNRTDRTRRTLYGFVLAALIAVCQLVPMATLASSMPATGGSYVYAKKLIGPRHLSYS